jgi:hypothetical protein
MYILAMHSDLRALWSVFTLTARLYILCLMAGTFYSTYSLVRITFRLNRIRRSAVSDSVRVFEMSSRVESLRQFHLFLLLLFGVDCANEVVATLRAIQYSSASLSAARMDIFKPLAAFSFFVFVVLLFLHVFQWAVSTRLRRVVTASKVAQSAAMSGRED